jgi:hypothetical protein
MLGGMTMTQIGAAPMTMGTRGERAEFKYLASQHGNNCGLDPGGFGSMNPAMRLQGACCGAMDAKLFPEYLQQLHELAPMNHGIFPRNPYDMSAGLAHRLVAYNDQILLSRAEQRVYDAAMRMAHDGGPCCCHCWRWVAFEGQAKFLIARRRYTAAQIAHVWSLDDGCGDTSAGMTMTG